MESSGFPLLYRLLAVLGDIVLDFLLLHERGEDGLINGVIWDAGEQGTRERGKQQGSLHTIDNEDADWRHDFLILGTLRRSGFGIRAG